jgi:hypothetical protein
MINWSKISLQDLAGYLSEKLRKKGIETYLVGGACVTIYSKCRYQSYDLDYITYEDMITVNKALTELGFVERNGCFEHKGCQWFVEFVAPPVAVGNEPVTKFNSFQTPLGTIKLLYPVDIVKDRLASYYYWDDLQSLDQAIKICLEQNIDLGVLELWSQQENQIPKFQDFLALLKVQ